MEHVYYFDGSSNFRVVHFFGRLPLRSSLPPAQLLLHEESNDRKKRFYQGELRDERKVRSEANRDVGYNVVYVFYSSTHERGI
jgi:hypothetical protein